MTPASECLRVFSGIHSNSPKVHSTAETNGFSWFPATLWHALGNRRSIRLSYGGKRLISKHISDSLSVETQLVDTCYPSLHGKKHPAAATDGCR